MLPFSFTVHTKCFHHLSENCKRRSNVNNSYGILKC